MKRNASKQWVDGKRQTATEKLSSLRRYNPNSKRPKRTEDKPEVDEEQKEEKTNPKKQKNEADEEEQKIIILWTRTAKESRASTNGRVQRTTDEKKQSAS